MRTIVQEFPHHPPTVEEFTERYALLNSTSAMEIELQTPAECRELLPVLYDIYIHDQDPVADIVTDRAKQIEAQLRLCADPKLDPDQNHRPFLLTVTEARLLVSKLGRDEEIRRFLVASIDIGSYSILGMLEGEIGETYKDRYEVGRCRRRGKIALRAKA